MANLVYLAECWNTDNLKKGKKIFFTLKGGIMLYGRILFCSSTELHIKIKGRKPYIFYPYQMQEYNITLMDGD